MAAVQSLRFDCAPPGSPQEQGDWIEGLTDSLLEAGALTVSVEDPNADRSGCERPIFAEPGMPQDMQAWPLCRVTVLLDSKESAQAWWSRWTSALSDPFALCQGCAVEAQQVADCDWVGESQRQFEPILLESFGRPIWVGPHWHEPPPKLCRQGGLVLRIDPGMAFGTGGHATTQLCLRALQALAAQGPLGAVLDYGCGSGILAIAAARLGARTVTAVDIDPISVTVARANAQCNQASDTVHCSEPRPFAPGSFDLVMANILAQPLRLLAPLLWSMVRPGGGLILSGLLARQQEELTQSYRLAAPERPELTMLGQQDGWLCLGAWPAAFQPPPVLGDPQ